MGDNGERLRVEVVRMICASTSRNKPPEITGLIKPGSSSTWVGKVIADADELLSYIVNGNETIKAPEPKE